MVNLSKNLIFADYQFIRRYQSIRLKHKSWISLSNILLFFILPKDALIQNKKDKIDKGMNNIVPLVLKKKKQDKHFVPDSNMLDDMDNILEGLIETISDKKVKV